MRLLIAAVLLTVATLPATAQQNDATKLTAENQRLREKVKRLEDQLAKAERAGFQFSETGYSSVLEILKNLPKELSVPNSGTWQALPYDKGHQVHG